MATATADPVPTTPRRSPWRTIAAGICFFLSFLLTVPAVVGYWGQRTLTDAQRYAATVAPMADDPVIQAAVTAKVNEALVTGLDVNALLKEWLPPKAQPLAAPLSGAINSFIEREVTDFLASEQFDQLWLAINEKAQEALVGVLSGNPTGAVSVQGADLVLDLGDLITEVKNRLIARGLTVLEKVPVPQAADRQIVLLHSEQLATARTIYAFSVPIARWLIVIVLLLALAAIGLARRRARMVVSIGAGLILSMILLRLGLKAGETYLGASIPDTQVAQAAQAFFGHLTAYLVSAIRVGYVAGILMIAFGWLFGRSGSAVATRGAISGAIGGAGNRAATTGPLATVGSWVAPKRTVLIAAVIAVAGLVLILADSLTAGMLLVLTLLVLVAVAVILVLAAAGRPGEAADDAPEEVGAGVGGPS